jgi:hypothetical protein
MTVNQKPLYEVKEEVMVILAVFRRYQYGVRTILAPYIFLLHRVKLIAYRLIIPA